VLDIKREGWKGRLLRATCAKDSLIIGRVRPTSHMGAVAMSVIAHSSEQELLALMSANFAPFYSIGAPFPCTAGKIAKTGHIIADVVMKDDQPRSKNVVLFRNLADMESRWRSLADRLRFTDAERIELFAAVKAWVVADYRLDPMMNPMDPDARRLVA
jgi:hypothetical protein